MKLRTEMDACLPRGSVGDIEHDAAAAHALLAAVKEHHASIWLENRADELMREWGFEQERVG